MSPGFKCKLFSYRTNNGKLKIIILLQHLNLLQKKHLVECKAKPLGIVLS